MRGYKIIKKLENADYRVGAEIVEGMNGTQMLFRNLEGEEVWRSVGTVELQVYVERGYMEEVEVTNTPSEE